MIEHDHSQPGACPYCDDPEPCGETFDECPKDCARPCEAIEAMRRSRVRGARWLVVVLLVSWLVIGAIVLAVSK